jgi:hypothetical protein
MVSVTTRSGKGSELSFAEMDANLTALAAAANLLLPTAVAYGAAVPFTGNLLMPQQTVSGAIAFSVNTTGALDGSVTQLDLIANGTNTPTFSAPFRQWGGSMAYDNRAGIRNSLTFFRRSGVYYYAITQAVGAVAEAVDVPPSFSVAPSIIGTPAVGAASSFTSGTAAGSPAPTLTQQWLIDDVAVSGATGATYTPAGGDSGKVLKVRQTATNTSGSVNSTSAGVTVAAALAVPGAPTALAAGTIAATTVQLTWGAPSTGGGAITDYVIQYAAAGTSFASPVTVSDGTSATTGVTVSGLSPSTAYDFRVAAVNAAGQGAYANLLAVSTASGMALVSLQNLVSLTEGPAYTYTSPASAPGVYCRGNAGTASMAGDGAISIDLTSSADRFHINLDTTNTLAGFDNADYSCWLFSNGQIYISSNAGTGTSVRATNDAGPSRRYMLRRVSGTVTCETSADAGATWTVLHTFAATSSATLFASWMTLQGSLKIVNPRAEGLA